MKIKRWIILTTVFAVLASSIVASGCQPSNTASTSPTPNAPNNEAANECATGCANCWDYQLSNCNFNEKTYDCTTGTGCTDFWLDVACNCNTQMCINCLNGDCASNNNANN